MKVAFANYIKPDDISGVTTWLLTLAKRLQSDGISVAIHFAHNPGEDCRDTFQTRELLELGIHLSWATYKSSLNEDVKQTLQFLNHWQPDIFLPQCISAHYVAAAQAGMHGLPWVLTLHSDDPDYWAAVRSLGTNRHGGTIVSVSQHIQNKLINEGNHQPSSVIPYGVIIPAVSAQPKHDPFRVVFCGRIWEHQKRASLVIQTLIRACQANASIQATMIGEGYARPSCQEQVDAAGLSDAITFTGPLDPSQVQAHLEASQAILLMSDFEGLPVALLEAMAFGVVPVARNIPSGIPELVIHEQTGIIVSDDPDEAAQALLHLAADRALWLRCSAAARTLICDRYSQESSYGKWRLLLEELVQRRTTPSSSPYPIDPRKIISRRHIDPLLLVNYQKKSVYRTKIHHFLRTAVAQTKHRIKRLLTSTP